MHSTTHRGADANSLSCEERTGAPDANSLSLRWAVAGYGFDRGGSAILATSATDPVMDG